MPEHARTPVHLSVIVLCYRSEWELVPVVEHLHKLLSLLGFAWEVVLVANYIPGAHDATPEVVEKLARELSGIRTVIKPKEGMMGWDMRAGLEAARGEYLAVIDGDGQFPMEAVIAGFLRLIDGETDLVFTERVSRGDGPYRRLLSFCYNVVTHLLFPGLGVRDINSKPKLITRDLYERLKLEDSGWFIDAEIVLKANLVGARIQQFPIYFYRLAGRHSFVRFTAIREFISKLVAFRLRQEEIRRALRGG